MKQVYKKLNIGDSLYSLHDGLMRTPIKVLVYKQLSKLNVGQHA